VREGVSKSYGPLFFSRKDAQSPTLFSHRKKSGRLLKAVWASENMFLKNRPLRERWRVKSDLGVVLLDPMPPGGVSGGKGLNPKS